MTDAQLTYWSSWASIISFFVSVASLLFVRSIRANIIRFRRKQRIKQLLDEVQRIHDDAIPLGKASKTKLAALQRNIPAGLLHALLSAVALRERSIITSRRRILRR